MNEEEEITWVTGIQHHQKAGRLTVPDGANVFSGGWYCDRYRVLVETKHRPEETEMAFEPVDGEGE